MLNFQRPLFFLLLFLLPAFVLLRRAGKLQAVSIVLPLGNWNGFMPEKNLQVYFIHRLSQYVLAAAFVFAVAALAEPVRQTSEAMYSSSGQALMFVIDTSPSMAAQDMGTETRLEAAKRIIKSFAEKYEGDSLGLTALGSSAAVLIPPTIDRHTFLTRLDQLQVGELGDGTAIGMGLASAVLHLTQYSTLPSHIILFTDGDNNTGEVHPRAAADIIKHKKIGFYIIGLGKSGYAPVKYIEPIQKKEISGTLNTVFNETELQKIARYGNGRYFSAKSPELLTDIFNRFIQKIPATPPAMTMRKQVYLDNLFLLIAMGCAAGAWLLRRFGMQAVS
ncbi:hypothetical protein HMPREF1222_01347 [Treponema vincentii F0403]|uniref:VWFA domain-containing protein n=1 Tax=Treponema vincentii F0403 TaxID=1125702 RepID=S3LAM3_9SPIR|nr:VWA domain-containing protein [Treponema vincentii]EPF46770.1 hypothetical protein HMPREF1222_01347 [Treponema vincentii F0403]